MLRIIGLIFFLLTTLQAKSDLTLQPSNTLNTQEILESFKNVKSPLKVDKEANTKGVYPYDTFSINSTTDSLQTLIDSSGNVVIYVISTKGADTTSRGGLSVDTRRLEDKTPIYYVQKYSPVTKRLEGAFLTTKQYYNGGHNFNAKYDEWGMPHSNSFGLWIKLSEYPKSDLTLFSRNEAGIEPYGYKPDYFHFQLLNNGLLRVSTKITDYSVDSLTTQKPLPLNKWVYIQAVQNGVDYQIGFKAQDNSENELVSKAFSSDTLDIRDDEDPKFSIQQNRVFDINFLQNASRGAYPNITIKEAFYQPQIAMFELMDKFSAKEKLVFTTEANAHHNPRPLAQRAMEAYNILAGGQGSISTISTRNDFDIYYDTNTLNVIVIDFRNNRK